MCWESVDLHGLQRRPYRSDRLALAVHPDHPLAGRASIGFEQSLDHDHVGLPPGTAVHTMLNQAAARLGRTISYRVVVTNFDSSLRVVAANLGISVIPMEVGRSFSSTIDVELIPLTDAWASRRFAVCFRTFDALQPAARLLVNRLVRRAEAEARSLTTDALLLPEADRGTVR